MQTINAERHTRKKHNIHTVPAIPVMALVRLFESLRPVLPTKYQKTNLEPEKGSWLLQLPADAAIIILCNGRNAKL